MGVLRTIAGVRHICTEAWERGARGDIIPEGEGGGGGRYTNICTPKIGVAEICAPQSCGNELVHDSKSQQIRTTIVPESRTHVLEEALDL